MFKPWETAEETRSEFAAMGIPGTSTVMSAIAISVLIAILPAPTMGNTGIGHRGYSDYHRGYRRQGDYWFPLAAFATGALITGAIINNNQNRVYAGNLHVQWCHDRYRSYRASDNTFQPYYGPRQADGNSPF